MNRSMASPGLTFCPSSVWWNIPLIPVIRKLRPEGWETGEVIFCYIVMLRLAHIFNKIKS